jgi:Alanyl-tRNA synthetase
LKKIVIKKNDLFFLSKEVDLDVKNMKELAFELGSDINSLYLVLGTKKNNKPTLCCFISKDLVKSRNYDASEVVKNLCKYIDGSGGGQKFYASAGGKKISGLKEALDISISFL